MSWRPKKVVTKTGHHTQQQLDQILNKNKGISVENRPSYLWFKIAAIFSSNFSAEKHNLIFFHCELFKCYNGTQHTDIIQQNDTQHTNFQYNIIQHTEIQHNDTEHTTC